eukprot:scaffold129981_cov33-Tisochrysis_lutea.AAC.4
MGVSDVLLRLRRRWRRSGSGAIGPPRNLHDLGTSLRPHASSSIVEARALPRVVSMCGEP